MYMLTFCLVKGKQFQVSSFRLQGETAKYNGITLKPVTCNLQSDLPSITTLANYHISTLFFFVLSPLETNAPRGTL